MREKSFLFIFCNIFYVLVTEIYSHFTIEGSTGFLKREIVIKLCIGEIAALEREVVASAMYAVAQGEVMGKLVGNDIIV